MQKGILLTVLNTSQHGAMITGHSSAVTAFDGATPGVPATKKEMGPARCLKRCPMHVCPPGAPVSIGTTQVFWYH